MTNKAYTLTLILITLYAAYAVAELVRTERACYGVGYENKY